MLVQSIYTPRGQRPRRISRAGHRVHMKLDGPGPHTFVSFGTVFGAHMLAIVTGILRKGRGIHKASRADNGMHIILKRPDGRCRRLVGV